MLLSLIRWCYFLKAQICTLVPYRKVQLLECTIYILLGVHVASWNLIFCNLHILLLNLFVSHLWLEIRFFVIWLLMHITVLLVQFFYSVSLCFGLRSHVMIVMIHGSLTAGTQWRSLFYEANCGKCLWNNWTSSCCWKYHF